MLKPIHRVACSPALAACQHLMQSFALWLCDPHTAVAHISQQGLQPPVLPSVIEASWLWDFLQRVDAGQSLLTRAQAMAAMPVAQKAALAAWVQTVAALATQFQPTPAPWPTNRPIASEPDWEAFKALMQAFYKKGLESGLPYTPNGTPVAAGGVSYADYVRIFRDEHRLSLNADSHEVCVLCGGRLGQTPEVDHWVSQSAFPLLSVCADNLLPTCGDCNSTANKGQKNVHSAGSFVDWFHPYLRPGHGAIQLVYQPPDLHVRCSAIALADQPKATALDALLNLSSRWTREFKAKYAERKDVLIRRERKRLQSGQARHTEGEILSYVQEWEEDLSLSEPHYEVHRTLAAALQEQSRLSAWLGELSFVQ